ncbi:MAG TPA: ABC transporter ATP-binding protein [Actinomycetes bacterium]
MPATQPTTFTGGVAARTVAAVKRYGTGSTTADALAGVTVAFEAGRFTAVMGPSGSGKSTLLHCLAGLDTLTSGQILLGGVELGGLAERERTLLRRDRIGVVFQAFNLLPALTAADNITLPSVIAGRPVDPELLAGLVGTLGLGRRLGHRPAELSGGEQQRVAAARALLGQPELVVADEPTGNLDAPASAELLGMLRQAVRELGRTIVMVTHGPVAAAYADRVVFLADGRLVGELPDPTAEAVLEAMKRLERPDPAGPAGCERCWARP